MREHFLHLCRGTLGVWYAWYRQQKFYFGNCIVLFHTNYLNILFGNLQAFITEFKQLDTSLNYVFLNSLQGKEITWRRGCSSKAPHSNPFVTGQWAEKNS
jgi:hypothetical protein